MLVRLNCWRGENSPGDVVDVDEAEAAGLLAHGGAQVVPPRSFQEIEADLPQAAAKDSP